MRKQFRRGEQLFAVVFLFLFAIVLWWELNLRDATVAKPRIPDRIWDVQGTLITVTSEQQTQQQGIHSHQEFRRFTSVSDHDVAEAKSNATVQLSFEENGVFQITNETHPEPEREPESWNGIFDSSISNVSMAPYTLIELYESEHVRERMCKDLTSLCQKFSDFTRKLHEGASVQANSRLHILQADPLAWAQQRYPDLSADVTKKVAGLLNASRSYITYKGSDHVIVCLSESCQQWATKFARILAGGQGSRAIYIGINVNEEQLKWPCPHRVINLDINELHNMSHLLDKILRVSTLMIEKRNRWVCSDAQHPPNHFGEHNRHMAHGGIYMDE